MPSKRGNERSDPKMKLADPYLLSKAYSEPTVCPSCGLVFHKKRWVRDEYILNEVSAVAKKHKCPACRKIDDHYVMGVVTIDGDFFLTVRNELVNLIHNQKKKESFRNPLSRIMSLKYKNNNIVVETTTENLAVMIGKALQRSHNGELEINFSNDELARVHWTRNLETGKSKKKK
jgi:NMD protein affecting ribosome stability and mRNA decay